VISPNTNVARKTASLLIRPTDAPNPIPYWREEVFNSIWEGLAQGNNVLILDAPAETALACPLPHGRGSVSIPSRLGGAHQDRGPASKAICSAITRAVQRSMSVRTIRIPKTDGVDRALAASKRTVTFFLPATISAGS
jgi:hypothetical protein